MRSAQLMGIPALLLAASLVAGCTSIFSVRIPLGEATHSPSSAVRNVVIVDQRPVSERSVHTGGGLSRCERWYGDDTYVPSKLEYLQQLLATRMPGNAITSVTLQRFDTIEYCDNTANRAGAAAAAGASAGATGMAVYIPPRDIPGGDSVLVRLVGEINGAPFDLSRRFDYSDLPYNTWTEMPGDSPRYRERMTNAMKETADELAALARMGKEK